MNGPTPVQMAAMEAAIYKWLAMERPPDLEEATTNEKVAYHFGGGFAAATELHADLLAAAIEAREAIRLTREYVGEKLLPNIEGWSHYDADRTLEAAITKAQRGA